jgi:acyl-CoA thioesterase
MSQTPKILGQRFAQHDAFAREVGVELLDVSQGHAKVKLDLTDKHRNSFGTVHGGVVFTVADVAFAIAANSHGTVAMAINVSISYLKAVTEGTLYAEANEISRNPKLSTYAVDVTNEVGERIATFHGMTYRKKDPIPGG